MADSHSDKTTEILRRRLASAEQDTQQLMRQLEEMGFSTSSKEKINNPRIQPDSLSCENIKEDKNSNKVAEEEEENSKNEKTPLSTPALKTVQIRETGDKGVGGGVSSRHKPITPLSLQGLNLPTGFEGTQSKSRTSYTPYCSRDTESSRRKQRTGNEELQIGRQELEQELLRIKRVASQLEGEVKFETESKLRAREEAERFKNMLDENIKSQTEKDIAIEDLSASKQKLTKTLSELREEVTREASLRSSLEESHKSLLSRLQDMETVIETLRSEGKTHLSSANNLKTEVARLRDELEHEAKRRKKTEEIHAITLAEKDRFKVSLCTSKEENHKASQELGRLQAQYSELISQLSQTEQVTESLKMGKQNVEQENKQLSQKVKSLTEDLEVLTRTQEETKEGETRLSAEKSALEADFCRMKAEKEKAQKNLKEREAKLAKLETELAASKQTLTMKNEEFSSAANGLEIELASLKSQLEAMENEKQNILKDKESLLEEVNQTVDTLMSERSRLQTEVQASMVEGEALRIMCNKLEQDKAAMLERISSYQHHQNTQRKVEDSLNQMVEAKNKLAYDNGKLQSTIHQLQLELDNVTHDQGDVTQMKKLCQSLQAKYTQSQQEISEYKISLQRAEVQARTAVEELEVKDKEMKAALVQREEMDKELEKVSGRLEVLEDREVYKVDNYKKSMEEAKGVNQDMANTLEAVMSSHAQLQTIVENLQVELGKRDSQITQLKACRNKDTEDLKNQITDYEMKFDTLKVELRRERESSDRKSAKNLSEMRKEKESLSCRNQDLVRHNTELRQRVSEGEKEKEELKSKLSGQRHKLEYLHRAKKQLEDNYNKMKTVRKDISELEDMRDEYMKKNKDQAETISKFISQINHLQDEVKEIAQAHVTSQELLKLKDEALDKEKRISLEMRRRYLGERKKGSSDTYKESQQPNEKLREVHSESLEISKHLQEAHDWFRGKFDKLQTELTESKVMQAKLAKENQAERKSLEGERTKAEDAAQRAKEMIQSSRQTISKLADYAEITDADTKQQLAKLRAELQAGSGLSPGKLSMTDLEIN